MSGVFRDLSLRETGRNRFGLIADQVFNNGADFCVLDDAAVFPNSIAEFKDSRIDPVSDSGSKTGIVIPLADYDTQILYVFRYNVEWTPDTCKVMHGKKACIKFISFLFGCSGNRWIDDTGCSFPGEKYWKMVCRSRLYTVMKR